MKRSNGETKLTQVEKTGKTPCVLKVLILTEFQQNYVIKVTHTHILLLPKSAIYNSNRQIYQLYMSSAVKIVALLQQKHMNILHHTLLGI